MSKPIVRCRCGHQVLAKEVLRTDLYERRASEGSSREYVYVKYRCQRCKRMGEAFVPESRWDRSILEPAQNEMNDTERDQFLDEAPISDDEVLDFHKRLQNLADLNDLHGAPREAAVKETAAKPAQERQTSVAGPIEAGELPASSSSEATSSSAQPPQAGQLPVAPPTVQNPGVPSPGSRTAKANPPENTPPNQASAGCPPEEPHSRVFRGDTP
jgi:DNA-directed RNA polymerase subunit RPC12/RpoP